LVGKRRRGWLAVSYENSVDVFFGLEHSFEAVLDAFFERDKSTYEGFYDYGVVGD
jgi:hypothetical protein